MCGFGVSNKPGIELANQYCQRRGPDITNIENINGIDFLHNLLHITGTPTKQPFVQDDIAVVFNGEIYNYQSFGSYASDGECLIDLYKEHGAEFVRRLDGEFAICLVDFVKRRIVLGTDAFACKPLWTEFKAGTWAAASYQSQLRGLGFNNAGKLPANTTRIYDLDTLSMITQFATVQFDIRQTKTSFDDWVQAFSNSIRKRTQNTKHGMFVGMSSGYDSGAIACELTRQRVDFKAYSIINNENMSVLDARTAMLANNDRFELSADEYAHWQRELVNCEDFEYRSRTKLYNIKSDQASMGLSAICDRARNEHRRIYFSGQGADEIMSDYGFNGRKIFKHSEFGGLFPSDLTGFWPWYSFYDGTQIQYLNKEEYIAGHFGIETRYPFLDRDLVQEFLWLSAKLKNSKYKNALAEYLERNNWPFAPEEKLGFHITEKKSKK